MARTLKILVFTLLGLLILVFGGLFAVTQLLDPNDYRQDIEQALQKHGGINVHIGGELNWSLYPWLGLELNDIAVKTQAGENFTQLSNMQARVDVLSLIKMSPRVGKLVVDGLSLELIKNVQGKGNWEALVKERPAESTGGSSAPENNTKAPATSQPKETADAKPIDFAVSEVAVINARVHYQDQSNGTDVLLAPFNLAATDIRKDSAFPLTIDFTVQDNKAGITAENSIKTQILLGNEFKRITLAPFTAKFNLSGTPFKGKTVTAGVNSQITFDQTAQTLDLKTTEVTLADLLVQLNAHISQLNAATPKVEGDLAIPTFSLKALLDDLGQAPIATAKDSALTQLGFTTRIRSQGEEIQLPDAKLQVDQSNFATVVAFNQKSGRIVAKLTGDTFNADHYLPPPVDEEADKSPPAQPSTPAGTAGSQSDELPIDALKGLNFDLHATLKQFIVKNLAINDIVIKANANEGIIKLERAAGQLYDGDFLATANINVARQTPTWQFHEEVNKVSLLPLLKDFKQLELITGRVNLKSDLTSSGSQISQIKQQAKGTASFHIDEGTLEGLNLKALACQGVAKLLGKQVDTSAWAAKTEFNDLKGNVDIQGPMLTNPVLLASLAGIALEGGGTVDTLNNSLAYGLGLKVLGELGDPNCEVNKYLKDVSIPVKCDGGLGGDSAPTCGLDTAKLGKMLEQIAKKEVERKLDKALDKKLDKLFGKKKETTDENSATDGTENTVSEKDAEKDAQKEAVKGLLKGFLK